MPMIRRPERPERECQREPGTVPAAGGRGQGRAGLAFAFDVLGAKAVVSCTVRHNVRSRAVMERIGMRYAGEIRSRGMVEGVDGEQDDAPFSVCVLLREDRARSVGAAAPPSRRRTRR